MTRACLVCLLLCGFTPIAGEPTAPEATVDEGSVAKPPAPLAARPPVDVTPIIADLREVHVKLQTACRIEYGDSKCMSLKLSGVKQHPMVGQLQ
jgi:hypothetical protein